MLLDEKINDLQKLTQRKISYQQVADVLGLGSKQAAYNRVTRKQHLKDWEILALDNAFNGEVNITNQELTTNDGFVFVDYYPDVFGSCGSGTFVLSEQKELIQIPNRIYANFSKSKKYSVINAVGDSMSPTINNKDKLIVEHYNGEQIKDNHIYVFCYNNELFVKRLVKNINEIIIKSDNPEQVYSARLIEKDDMNNIEIIGEIVGLMRVF